MALFNFKKEKKTVKVVKAPKVTKLAVASGPKRELSEVAAMYGDVLSRPRITEKAALVAESKVYVFDVKKGSTKADVKRAVKAFYNVLPRAVHITTIPAKQVFVRGKWGTKKGGKKAYVYLAEGDTIEVL